VAGKKNMEQYGSGQISVVSSREQQCATPTSRVYSDPRIVGAVPTIWGHARRCATGGESMRQPLSPARLSAKGKRLGLARDFRG